MIHLEDNFLLRSHLQAGASGLRLLGHRYYDASTGRFLTRDPIKDGRNWYAYGAGEANPLTGVDPTGLSFWYFNGKEFILVSDDGKRRRVIDRFPASSGKPGTGPRDQGRENIGPVPEGSYRIWPSEVQRPDNSRIPLPREWVPLLPTGFARLVTGVGDGFRYGPLRELIHVVVAVSTYMAGVCPVRQGVLMWVTARMTF